MCPFCKKPKELVRTSCTKCSKEYQICQACLAEADLCTTCGHNFCTSCRLPSLSKCNDCLIKSLTPQPVPTKQPVKQTAQQTSSTTDKATGFGSTSGPLAACKPKPMVVDTAPGVRIECDDVACPGLPLKVIAVGTPEGGTYAWTSDGEIRQAASQPDRVMLFQIDPGNVEIRVAYDVSGSTYRASKRVRVHDVHFTTVALHRFPGVLAAEARDSGLLVATKRPDDREPDANEQALAAELDRATGGEADEAGGYAAAARVRIDLTGCPNPGRCADNWRVGFLQNIELGVKTSHYVDIDYSIAFAPALPAIDSHALGADRPFYDGRLVRRFTGHLDEQYVVMSDSPACAGPTGEPRPWDVTIDNDAVTIEFGALQHIRFAGRFHVWLAAENRCWRDFHLLKPESNPRAILAYVRLADFTWSFDHTYQVDTSLALAARTNTADIAIAQSAVATSGPAPEVLGKTAEERMSTTTTYDESQIPSDLRVQVRFTLTGELPDLPEDV